MTSSSLRMSHPGCHSIFVSLVRESGNIRSEGLTAKLSTLRCSYESNSNCPLKLVTSAENRSTASIITETRASVSVVPLPAYTAVSYTHLRAHETGRNLVCRLLLEKKKKEL